MQILTFHSSYVYTCMHTYLRARGHTHTHVYTHNTYIHMYFTDSVPVIRQLNMKQVITKLTVKLKPYDRTPNNTI